MDLFVGSYYVSVFVQIIALVVQFYGYMLPVTNELMPLKYALNLEFIVSIVELIVYIWIAWSLKSLPSVMMKRYLYQNGSVHPLDSSFSFWDSISCTILLQNIPNQAELCLLVSPPYG